MCRMRQQRKKRSLREQTSNQLSVLTGHNHKYYHSKLHNTNLNLKIRAQKYFLSEYIAIHQNLSFI